MSTLNSKRVKRAEELLYDKKMSITDVAMNSGFSSLSAFNRTFKTVKACSPSDYRRQRESMVQALLMQDKRTCISHFTVLKW